MGGALRCGLHPELRAAQRRAADALGAAPHGCRVVEVGAAELPEMAHAFSIWSAMLQVSQDHTFGEVHHTARSV